MDLGFCWPLNQGSLTRKPREPVLSQTLLGPCTLQLSPMGLREMTLLLAVF